MNNKLKIDDISKLKITKIKSWAIYFTYDNQRYLLHENDEDTVSLYKRVPININIGLYKLERITYKYGRLENYRYIKMKDKKTYPYIYSHIDIENFIIQLTKDGFVYGAMDKKTIEVISRNVIRVRKIKELEKEILKLKNEME